MEYAFIILIILALIIFACLGFAAFIRVGWLKEQVTKLEKELESLKGQLPGSFADVSASQKIKTRKDEIKPENLVDDPEESSDITSQDERAEEKVSETSDHDTSDDVDLEKSEDAAVPAYASKAENADQNAKSETPKNTKAPQSIDGESAIGGKFTIWAGGIILAIGGLYLAKYSIDAGLLGPRARTIVAFIFGLIVAFSGEWTRRRPERFALQGFENANIPAILTSVGIFTMFGAVFAAHALYGLIGPTTSFILLAILAFASLIISLLHGPLLAVLGLLSSYLVPFLINSDSANVPVLVTYILVLSAAAMYVAWYRAWLWCALMSVGAMLAYAFALEAAEGEANSVTLGLYILGTIALTYISLVWSVHERKPDADMQVHWMPTLALSALFLPVLFHLPRDQSLIVHLVELGCLIALPLAAAYRYPALRFVTFVPAIIAALKYWTMFAPIKAQLQQIRDMANQTPGEWNMFPTETVQPYMSDNVYLTIGTVAILALLAFSTYAAHKARARLVIEAVSASLALAIFVSAYWRISNFEASTQFALFAMILFALFHLKANHYHQKLEQALIARDGTIAAALVGAMVSLSLSVSLYLSGIGLTISLGLITAATMLTHMRYSLKGLRIFAALAVLPYAGRLIWEPFVDPDAITNAPPIFNILLLAYGIPMLGYIYAAYVATKHKNDLWAQILQAIAIISSVVTVTMLALHAIDPGFAFETYETELAVAATLVMIGGAFSLGLTRLKTAAKSRLLSWSAEGLGLLGMLIGAVTLFLSHNPVMQVSIMGYRAKLNLGEGIVFNLINYAYLLPFILFGLLVWQARHTKSKFYQWVSLIFTVLLGAYWINLTIRYLFHGEEIATASVTQVENYTYSIVWLLVGLLVLYLGIIWRQQLLRKLSGLIILIVVLKAFLIDMSHLEGVLRAISFIGLGGVLIGIGFVYQRALRGLFNTSAPVESADANEDGEGLEKQ